MTEGSDNKESSLSADFLTAEPDGGGPTWAAQLADLEPDAGITDSLIEPDLATKTFTTLEHILRISIDDTSTTESQVLQLLQDSPDLLTVITCSSGHACMSLLHNSMKARKWNSLIDHCNWFKSVEVDPFVDIVRKMEIALLDEQKNDVIDCLHDLHNIGDFPVNVKLHKGNTLLHLAAQHSIDTGLICQLLAKGASTDTQNDWGETVVHIACRTCYDTTCSQCGALILHKIILSSSNCNILNFEGETGLHHLLKNSPQTHQSSPLLPSELLAKFDPNIQDSNNDTIFHLACKRNPYLIEKLMLTHGLPSSIFSRNKDDLSVPDIILDKCLIMDNHAHIYQHYMGAILQNPECKIWWSPTKKQLLMIHHLYMSQEALEHEFFLSTCFKHPTISSSFFAKNEDMGATFLGLINSKNYFSLKVFSQAPESDVWFKNNSMVADILKKALEEDDDHMFDALIQNQYAAVDFKFKKNNTLLHIALKMKTVSQKNMLSLISHPLSDPNTQNQDGDTPVHIACKLGKYSFIRVMFQYKSLDHLVRNKSGNTPLMEALIKCKNCGNIKVPSELFGVFPDIHEDDTILHVATRVKYAPKLFDDIIKSDYLAYHSLNKDNHTPLLIALKTQQFKKAESLLMLHKKYNRQGFTLVHHLCTTDFYDSLEAILAIPQYRGKLSKTDKEGNTALHIASSYNSIKSVQLIVSADKSLVAARNNSGETPLHLASQKRHTEIVSILLECNPAIVSIKDDDGCLPLHSITALTGDSKLVKILLEKDPDPVNSLQSKNCDGDTPFHLICRENSKLLQDLISNFPLKHLFLIQDRLGNTPLHLILKQHTAEETMESFESALMYIDKVPMLRNKDGISIFHQCIKEHSEAPLMAVLKKAQGQMPCDFTFELIQFALSLDSPRIEGAMMVLSAHVHDHIEGSSCQKLNSLIHYAAEKNLLNMAQLLVNDFNVDPSHLTSNNDTPLHYACLHESIEVAQFLLSTTKCDIHANNSIGKSPLELSKNSIKMLTLLNKFEDLSKSKKTYPIDSYCKVFVTGHSGVGKSTIVTVFKNFAHRKPRVINIDRFRKVTEVEPFTAGIIPSTFTGESVGNIIIYDLAGHFEYHSSHAAILENLISSSSPLFILVVDLSGSLDAVKEQLQYWLNLLQNECTRLSNASPVIVIGSHNDIAKNKQNYTQKKKLPFQVITHYPLLNVVGFVSMDCRFLSSPELNLLHQEFAHQCQILRQFSPKVNLFCHGLYAFLMSLPDVAVTLEQVRNGLEGIEYVFIPTDLESLSEILVTLSDKGLVLFLKKSEDLSNSWIILQKQILLSKIHGRLFAPQHFNNHVDLESSTGLISKSVLASSFSQFSVDMLVEFLVHFELCQEFDKDAVLQANFEGSEDLDSDQLLFFPALIKDDDTSYQYWPPENTSGPDYRWFSWVLQCQDDTQQFFTYRFLHVLLLRLAFCYAASAPSEASNDSVEIKSIKRHCSMWKTGIRWLSNNGVWTMVHLTNNNHTLQMLMASPKTPQNLPIQNLSVVRYRSKVMTTIINTQVEFCKGLTGKLYNEILNPSAAMMPTDSHFCLLSSESRQSRYSLVNITRALLEKQDADDPCNIVDTVRSKPIALSDLLMFESYKGFDKDVITKLFAAENQEKHLGQDESFVTDLVESMSFLRDQFPDPLKFAKTVLLLQEKEVNRFMTTSQNETKFDQYVSVLDAWIQIHSESTYKNLRKCFDELSIFAGRNPLVSYFGIIIIVILL